ncbi:helix-turn-helix transcriptional regulator [Halospeciosus flavus]|uniref:Helix-turn-helix transcriptional regulator n=1 Tax=Halospeciosus flavus TaxID=3032283 RepID=A0ABD5Z7M2_9EURY|nr:hypothetical protein [Halospeciosus flavus]
MADRPDEGVAPVLKSLADNADLLERLLDGPARKQALACELDLSPKTVYRRARQLRDYDLVERCEEGYRLTATGRFHAELYREAADLSGHLYDGGDLFDDLDHDELPPPEIFADADVIRSNPVAPNQPLRRFEEVVQEADVLRGFSLVVFPEYVETFHQEIVEGGLQADLLLSESMLDPVTEDFTEQFTEVLDAENATFFLTDAEITYTGIVVTEPERRALLVVYAPGGGLRGVIDTTHPTAVEWVADRYDAYLADAEPVQG